MHLGRDHDWARCLARGFSSGSKKHPPQTEPIFHMKACLWSCFARLHWRLVLFFSFQRRGGRGVFSWFAPFWVRCFFFTPQTLRLLNALNSEGRGLKVRFSLAMIVFETFELILCQMLSSQRKNAPSNPYPHYLVRLATSRKSRVRKRRSG